MQIRGRAGAVSDRQDHLRGVVLNGPRVRSDAVRLGSFTSRDRRVGEPAPLKQRQSQAVIFIALYCGTTALSRVSQGPPLASTDR